MVLVVKPQPLLSLINFLLLEIVEEEETTPPIIEHIKIITLTLLIIISKINSEKEIH
jgi:hypothetical protein